MLSGCQKFRHFPPIMTLIYRKTSFNLESIIKNDFYIREFTQKRLVLQQKYCICFCLAQSLAKSVIFRVKLMQNRYETSIVSFTLAH